MNVAKVITGLQVVLLGFIAFLVVRALMVFFAPESAWTPLSQTADFQPNSTGLPQGQNTDLGPIDTSFDPFHRIVVAAAAPPVDVNLGEDAPETSLNLILKGQRVSQDGAALLQTPDGKQKYYYINDEILPGVTLEAVNIKFIVISQEGRLERLTFEKNDESGLRQAETSSATRSNLPANPQSTYSPNPLLSSINFTPERVNDEITGYKISPKQAGFDTALLGLEDGDVITSIGRIGLQDEDIDFGAVLSRLQSRRSTTVELIRNGQEISVKVGTP